MLNRRWKCVWRNYHFSEVPRSTYSIYTKSRAPASNYITRATTNYTTTQPIINNIVCKTKYYDELTEEQCLKQPINIPSFPFTLANTLIMAVKAYYARRTFTGQGVHGNMCLRYLQINVHPSILQGSCRNTNCCFCWQTIARIVP